MPPAAPRTRPPTRAERVVRAALEASLDELARVGFAALRVEDVATRAGVAKTTIYRRWPTKAELVRAALLRFSRATALPDTGSVAGDLEARIAQGQARLATAHGRGILRTMLAEGLGPDLAAIARSMQAEQDADYRRLLVRGQERGEIAADADLALVADILEGALRMRYLMRQRPIDARYARKLVALVLRAAAPDDLRASSPPRAPLRAPRRRR